MISHSSAVASLAAGPVRAGAAEVPGNTSATHMLLRTRTAQLSIGPAESLHPALQHCCAGTRADGRRDSLVEPIAREQRQTCGCEIHTANRVTTTGSSNAASRARRGVALARAGGMSDSTTGSILGCFQATVSVRNLLQHPSCCRDRPSKVPTTHGRRWALITCRAPASFAVP